MGNEQQVPVDRHMDSGRALRITLYVGLPVLALALLYVLPKIVPLTPKSVEVELEYITGLYQAGTYDAALTEVDLFLKKQPDSEIAWMLKADILQATGKKEDAGECYATALKHNPNSFHALFTLGEYSRQEGKVDEAMEYYSRAVQVDPSSKDCWCAMAFIELSKNNAAKAVEYGETAYRCDRGDSRTAALLAVIYKTTGDAEKQTIYAKSAEELGYKNLSEMYGILNGEKTSDTFRFDG